MKATQDRVSRLHPAPRVRRRSRCSLATRLCLTFALTTAPGRATAHPESLSVLLLGLKPDRLHAAMTLPTRDLSRWFPPGRYPDYVADVVRELRDQADSLLEVRWDDDDARPLRTNVHAGPTGSVVIELDYTVPAGAATLRVRSACLANLPDDHHQATSVDDDRAGTGGARVLAEETLTTQQDTLAVELPDVVPKPEVPKAGAPAAPAPRAAGAPSAVIPSNTARFTAPMAAGLMLTLIFLRRRKRPAVTRRSPGGG